MESKNHQKIKWPTKLTKGKRAVPYSKKKAPSKKPANEEPADEQYVDIDHYDYTEKDRKVVPRPGREKGRRETVVPQPSANALPSESSCTDC